MVVYMILFGGMHPKRTSCYGIQNYTDALPNCEAALKKMIAEAIPYFHLVPALLLISK